MSANILSGLNISKPVAGIAAGLSILVVFLSCLTPSFAEINYRLSGDFSRLTKLMPYSLKNEVRYQLALLTWGVWHEQVTGCRYVSNYQKAIRLLSASRPYGLTQEQISLLINAGKCACETFRRPAMGGHVSLDLALINAISERCQKEKDKQSGWPATCRNQVFTDLDDSPATPLVE